MKKEDYLIRVSMEGEIHTHIRNIGPSDHVTICGMDGYDTELGQEILPLKHGEKMNCDQCLFYYQNRKGLDISKAWLEKPNK